MKLLVKIFFIITFFGQAHGASAEELKAQISPKKLMKTYSIDKNLDAANAQFFEVMMKLSKRYSKLKANKNGFKLKKEEDRKLLIYVVESAEFFSKNIDGGLAHFFGLSKLYKVVPKDLSAAIERSRLNQKEKVQMRSAIKNNLKLGD